MAADTSSYRPHRWFPDWRALLATLVGGLVCTVLLHRQPFLAHDWRMYFIPESLSWQYPIFITYAMRPLTQWLAPVNSIAVLHGFTIAALAVYTFYLAYQAFPETPLLAYIAVTFVLVHLLGG